MTNFCTHYTAGLFEGLAARMDVDYYFYSPGKEWYWNHDLQGGEGNFRSRRLAGLTLGHTRITPALPFYLLAGGYDAYVKCINGKFALPASYLAARLRRKPFILRTGIWRRLETPLHRLLWPLTRYLYRHADAIVVYGSHVRQYLLSEGVPAERIFIAPHAVDNAFYAGHVPESEKNALRARLGIPAGSKVVLYMGRLCAVKGCRFLLQAFSAVRRENVVLVLAGSGEERGELEQMARESGAAVQFAGPVPWQQTVAYYALAYVCVLPSVVTPHEKELWGLVVNEAFNQGVPVIATRAVGAAAGGLVVNGVNGFVVREADAPALAAALDTVLQNEQRRDQMGRNAAAHVRLWTHDRMVEAFVQAVNYARGAGAPAQAETARQPEGGEPQCLTAVTSRAT